MSTTIGANALALPKFATASKCPTCGWLFSECVCQSVIANCNTCSLPIFGRENYDRRDFKSGPYKYSTFTCEVCISHKEAA